MKYQSPRRKSEAAFHWGDGLYRDKQNTFYGKCRCGWRTNGYSDIGMAGADLIAHIRRMKT